MWFITLVVLALAAFFIIKAVSASSKRKALENSHGSSGSQLPPASTEASSTNHAESVDATTSSVTADSPTSTDNDSSLLNTGNALKDAQEMIKILNLAAADASRLGIGKAEFDAINLGSTEALPNGDALKNVTEKLRRMLA